jgi:hypothetical protein
MGPAQSRVQFTDLQLRKHIYDYHVVEGLDLNYVIMFLRQAQLTEADPERKQVYLTGYFDKRKGHKVGTVVWSYQWMLDRANATGELAGVVIKSCQKESVYDPFKDEDFSSLVARAVVSRKGREPTEYAAIFKYLAKSDGKFWNANPHHQLQKTAIATALRWQFPEILSGCYIEGEHVQDEEEQVNEKDKAKELSKQFQVEAPKVAPVASFGIENLAQAKPKREKIQA